MQEKFSDLSTVKRITDKCWDFYNLKMQTDLDILTHLGLMYRRVAIVDIASSFYPRIERRISRHGRNYVQNILLQDLPISIRQSVRKRVLLVLDSQKEAIIECIMIESDGTPDERKKMAEKKRDLLVCLGG